MRMMKMAVDQVVDMVAVWNGFMSAAGTMHMSGFVTPAARRALIGILCADFDPVFVYMIGMRMMQMAVMEIVDVVAMPDRGVSAVRSMLVIMMGVVGFIAGAHGCCSPSG